MLESCCVDRPFGSRRLLGGAVGGRLQGDKADDSTGHFDVGNISTEKGSVVSSTKVLRQVNRRGFSLVEEWLKDDDFVTRLNEAHEGAQHALVCACGNGDFGVWIETPTHERRISI